APAAQEPSRTCAIEYAGVCPSMVLTLAFPSLSSSTSTRSPPLARASARFSTMEVLPMAGPPPATASTRGWCENCLYGSVPAGTDRTSWRPGWPLSASVIAHGQPDPGASCDAGGGQQFACNTG